MELNDICVMGGGGFVGRHIVRALAARGLRVKVPARDRERVKDLILLPTVDVVYADVHDPATLDDLVRGAGAVINLVGVLHDGRGKLRAAAPGHDTSDDRGALEDFDAALALSPDNPEVWGRPVALLELPDGSLLVSDDGGKKIWPDKSVAIEYFTANYNPTFPPQQLVKLVIKPTAAIRSGFMAIANAISGMNKK